MKLEQIKKAIIELASEDYSKFMSWYNDFSKLEVKRITESVVQIDIEEALINRLDSDAEFSECENYRYALWRIWNKAKPRIIFICLNPSTAGKEENDPTVRKIMAYARRWKYGGVYVVNCFPKRELHPENLNDFTGVELNDRWIRAIAEKCDEVVFAWGSSIPVVQKQRHSTFSDLFPQANILKRNKDGSPHHPLYLPLSIERTKWLEK